MSIQLTYTAILATDESARNTLALYMLAVVARGIAIIPWLHPRCARV